MTKFNMMAAKKYIDRNGDSKTQWVKIGSVIDNGVDENNKRKLFGNIDCMPNFEWDGSVNLFEQEEQQGGRPQQQQYQPQQQQQYQPQQQQQQQQYQTPVYHENIQR